MSGAKLKDRGALSSFVVSSCCLLFCATFFPQAASAQRQKVTYRCTHRLLGQILGAYTWDSSEQAYFQKEYIELKPDGTFFFQDYGAHITGYGGIESYYGKYDIDGNIITLKFE